MSKSPVVHGATAIVRLTALGAGGDAIGRLPPPAGPAPAPSARRAGLVVFVPGGAPGDLAEIDQIDPRKGYARGRLLRVLEPGPARTTPPCSLSTSCGGCPLMHVDRPTQLAVKEDLVRAALRHSGAEIRPIFAPTADLGYRIRARFISRGGQLGFQVGRSHHVTPVPTCPVLVPALDRALSRAGAAVGPLLCDEATLAGIVGPAGAVHLSVAPGPRVQPAAVAALTAALETLIADWTIAGAVLILPGGPLRLGAAAIDLSLSLSGAQSFSPPLPGSADAFAQASAPGHDLLPALVAEAVSGGPAAPDTNIALLELYAGSGNLTRLLVGRARRLVAVEGDPLAAARLRTLVRDRGEVLHAPAERAVASLGRAGERFDVVVLDPPRTGALGVVPELCALGPRRVVYVSCDPMTLGRDLALLRGQGYAARHVQPIDLMPHTAHVEAVAVLEREASL